MNKDQKLANIFFYSVIGFFVVIGLVMGFKTGIRFKKYQEYRLKKFFSGALRDSGVSTQSSSGDSNKDIVVGVPSNSDIINFVEENNLDDKVLKCGWRPEWKDKERMAVIEYGNGGASIIFYGVPILSEDLEEQGGEGCRDELGGEDAVYLFKFETGLTGLAKNKNRYWE